MATFTVPKEADQIDIVSPGAVQMRGGTRVNPLDVNAVAAPVEKTISIMQDENRKAKERTLQTFTAETENNLDRAVQENLNTVVSARGENSFRAGEEAQKKMQYDIDKVVSNAPPELRDRVTLLADQRLQRFDKTSIAHQYRQKKMVDDDAQKTRSEFITNDISTYAYNPEKFEESRALLARTVEVSMRQRLGGDPNLQVEPSPQVRAVIDIQKKAADSLALTKTVEGLVSAEDGLKAEEIAYKYQNNILPQDMIKVNALLKKGKSDDKYNRAKSLMDDAMAAFPGNPEDQRAYISHMSGRDGELFNAAVSMHTAQLSFDRTQKTEKEQEELASIQDKIRQARGNPAVVAQMIKQAMPENRAKLTQYAVDVSQGKTVVRNAGTYNALYQMYIDQPEKFGRQNLGAYAALLPNSDITLFQRMQKEVRDPLAAKYSSKNAQDIVNRVIMNQVATKYKPKDEKYKEQSAEIRSISEQVAQDVLASLPERATIQEFRRAFEDELVIRTQRSGDPDFMDKVKHYGSLGIVDLPKGGFSTNNTGIFEGFPSTLVDRVRKDLSDRGLDSSDSEVRRKLREIQYEMSKIKR